MPEAFLIRASIAVLCLVGLYASFFMLRKQRRALRGELAEPSVVTSPRARIAGMPNSLIGLVYYALLLVLVPQLDAAHPLAVHAALAAAGLAALASLYLAYSLLFITRLPCAYCWAGHVVNGSLFILLALLELSISR